MRTTLHDTPLTTPARHFLPDGALSPFLLADSCLGRCQPRELARVLPHLEVITVAAGEWIYQKGDAASAMFLLFDGEAVAVSPSGQERAITAGRLGEESASSARHYLTGAYAKTPVHLLVLPRHSLQQLMSVNHDLKPNLLLSLAGQLSGETLVTAEHTQTLPGKKSTLRLFGWAMSLLAPLLALWGGNALGSESNIVIFTAIFCATVTMWAFSLMDDYIPALFALLAILFTGLVPASVIFSGFASDGFMIPVCTLALGAVVVSSGLGYRFMLKLQMSLPNNSFGHFLSLFALGTLLTPIIPTAAGRIAQVAPFLSDIVDSLRLPPQSPDATRLALASFGGISLFSAMIMTSSSANFAVFALLSAQGQVQFQWLSWLWASAIATIVMLFLFFFLVWINTLKSKVPRLPKVRVAEQLVLLGKPAAREWAALAGVAFVTLGIMTTSIHHVQPVALVLAMLVGLLLTNTLDKKEFREKINWTILLYLGGVTALMSTVGYLGLDKTMGAAWPELSEFIRDQFLWFVFFLFLLTSAMRLFLPINATIVILATVFMPLADTAGINPWVVGFTILLFSETWFFPYQCAYYLPLQAHNHAQPLFDEKAFLRINALTNVARLLAAYASLPFWEMLGLL